MLVERHRAGEGVGGERERGRRERERKEEEEEEEGGFREKLTVARRWRPSSTLQNPHRSRNTLPLEEVEESESVTSGEGRHECVHFPSPNT